MSESRVAWFHCFSGIAGDMALGALADAGADLDEVRSFCERLPVGGWDLRAESVMRSGIGGTKVHVVAEDTTVVRTAAHVTALVEEAIGPLIEGFKPEALVIQCGADALADDPLGKQTLSNGALWHAVAGLKPLAPRLLVLGGGGYNPWSVARCWTGIWAELNGQEKPDRLPPAAESLLRELNWNRSAGRQPPEHWFTTLADAPRNGAVREEVRALVRRVKERMRA